MFSLSVSGPPQSRVWVDSWALISVLHGAFSSRRPASLAKPTNGPSWASGREFRRCSRGRAVPRQSSHKRRVLPQPLCSTRKDLPHALGPSGILCVEGTQSGRLMKQTPPRMGLVVLHGLCWTLLQEEMQHLFCFLSMCSGTACSSGGWAAPGFLHDQTRGQD